MSKKIKPHKITPYVLTRVHLEGEEKVYSVKYQAPFENGVEDLLKQGVEEVVLVQGKLKDNSKFVELEGNLYMITEYTTPQPDSTEHSPVPLGGVDVKNGNYISFIGKVIIILPKIVQILKIALEIIKNFKK